MVKCKVIEKFSLKDFDKLQNLKRASINIKGTLMMNDEFECDNQMAEYLTGKNPLKRPVVKIIEIIPENKVKEVKPEETPKVEIKENKPKKTNKKNSKKK